MDIRANPEGRVIGTVIEAEKDRAKGVIATLLVQNGTLKVSDVVIAGTAFGRIKAMFDQYGRRIRKVKPSTPSAVMGFNDVPNAGDLFQIVASDKEARSIIDQRVQAKEQARLERTHAVTLEQLFERFQAGELRELRLVIKADVQGSLEPIISSLEEMNDGDISINILQSGTGNIGESDVMLAAASKAIVIGFNVEADPTARKLAFTEGVSVRLYDIIDRLTEDVEKALKGMLEPEIVETVIGKAEVRAVFRISKVGKIAGCRVLEGELRRNANMRVVRDKQVIFQGDISSLKHHQDDVREVRQGFECGVSMNNFNEFDEGDILECYIIEEVAPI